MKVITQMKWKYHNLNYLMLVVFPFFQDFDVGKSYKKKVTLTNVSYTVNYCKYIDITERLKDFINIQ
jgi:hypothetical protein